MQVTEDLIRLRSVVRDHDGPLLKLKRPSPLSYPLRPRRANLLLHLRKNHA